MATTATIPTTKTVSFAAPRNAERLFYGRPCAEYVSLKTGHAYEVVAVHTVATAHSDMAESVRYHHEYDIRLTRGGLARVSARGAVVTTV
jgi:hypothetical protein